MLEQPQEIHGEELIFQHWHYINNIIGWISFLSFLTRHTPRDVGFCWWEETAEGPQGKMNVFFVCDTDRQ